MIQTFEHQCATLDSFKRLFNLYTDEGTPKIVAYEAVESMHISIYGRRRFSRYESFQNSIKNANRHISEHE